MKFNENCWIEKDRQTKGIPITPNLLRGVGLQILDNSVHYGIGIDVKRFHCPGPDQQLFRLR